MKERLHRGLVRVGAMASKEALHIQRDPRTLYLALIMPVVMLFVFGYGISFDIDRIPIAAVDLDQTPASRELISAFESARDFDVSRRPPLDQAESLLRRTEVLGALIIPQGYGRDLAAGRSTRVQLLVDGADGVVANQVLAKSDAIARAQTQRQVGLALRRASPPIQVKVWTRFNPEARSTVFMVPGLAAYLLALSAVLLTALAVAGEWERGSMEQLFASPVGRLEIVLGKLLPYLVLGMLELLLVLAFGSAMFDVPMRGSPLLLFVIGFFFLVGMLGQGLLISVLAKNQLVATQAGALSALLPSLLLSGMLFPIENMPLVLQWLSHVIPARYFVHALRDILLKGSGLSVVWPDLLAQVLFALAVIGITTVRFQRRLA